jgi:Glycogen debranching enzyme
MSERVSSHDLGLPAWGPYGKKYAGISHIADRERGLRFDLSVFPSLYRGRIDPPRATWESGYFPWEASPDLEHFSNRHELEWKDRLYADISFSRIDDDRRLVRCELVNNGELSQSLALHFVSFMNFPPVRTYSEDILRPARAIMPEGATWVDALDYESLSFARPRPNDGLVPDGMRRAEERGDGFAGGSYLGSGFGLDSGDRARFALPRAGLRAGAQLMLRYRMSPNATLRLRLDGCARGEITIRGTGGITNAFVELSEPSATWLEIVSQGGAALELDGFALGDTDALARARFAIEDWNPEPRILPGPSEQSLALKYDDCESYYGLAWSYADFGLRQFYCSRLDDIMRHNAHEHVAKTFRGDGFGHFADLVLRPIEVDAGTRRALCAIICRADSLEEARASLADPRLDETRLEALYAEAECRSFAISTNAPGERYRFSQERLATVALTNVVYPIYAKRAFIKHRTPGRWWDCLYTWDSGFIGLGLLEIDAAQAAENLEAYLTEEDDGEAAFMHHGSPVPVQFYLFLELWNKTGKLEYLRAFYPKLRHYYRFLAGKGGGSTTASLASGLLKTWDYFYNSGGWDDYPPQVEVHARRAEARIAPVITSSQVIRCAKILRQAALAQGLDLDIAEYEADIDRLTRAIQDSAWDGASGYFGYVEHDDSGRPMGILRHESGANFDMGLDGAYPLIAGVCTREQEERLLASLSSPDALWTAVGITTIDRRAPYYRIDGYWNGAVWMAHQWFFWKTMLDLGRGDFAFEIARTALESWKRETDDSYRTVEHFVVDSGRGAGWHHFGGLSCPVLNWFAAYYTPGRLNAGLDAWVESYSFSDGNRELEARLRFSGARRRRCVIATMAAGARYAIEWNGEAAAYEEQVPGSLCIEIEGGEDESGCLRVSGRG